jgi:pimeloyl-ACP methyl ester carboxylesterase
MASLTVTLHDGTALTATTFGSGPALVLPVRTEPHDEATAEGMRQWGADPESGATLAHGLSDRFRVIAADYEGHRMSHPAVGTLTPENLAGDLLAIADAAGAERFAYSGYSWLALAGLQLALRTDRLWALVMGGFPPMDGPYRPMLAVTRAAHEMATRPRPAAGEPVEPGDWDAARVTVAAEVTGQFVTLYENLQDFDDTAAQQRLAAIPRLAFAGTDDTVTYGPRWGDTVVDIAGPLARHRDELTAAGWTVELLAGLDHMSALHGSRMLPLLRGWLVENAPHPAAGPAQAAGRSW